MPPIDPEELAKRMQDIQDHIRELDSRKRALLEEREALMGPQQPEGKWK